MSRRVCWVLFCFFFTTLLLEILQWFPIDSRITFCPEQSLEMYPFGLLFLSGVSSLAFFPHHIIVQFYSICTSCISFPLTILESTSKIGWECRLAGWWESCGQKDQLEALFVSKKSSWVLIEIELKNVMKSVKIKL